MILKMNMVYGCLSIIWMLGMLLFVFLFSFNWVSYFLEWQLIDLGGMELIYVVLLDLMSVSFSWVVLLISSLVIFYSIYYMGNDPYMKEFIMMVYLFVLSMLILITSPNLFSILLGWDGLGLTSYCLVIYYHNVKSLSAGALTILTNRLGDLMLLICIVLSLNFGGLNIQWESSSFETTQLVFILVLLVFGGMTKSAQIPFSSWLPAAMSAPTPVSSLVHSSTLVTAGVYLIIRFNVMFEMNLLLLLFSLVTLLMAGGSALVEMDFKRIVALSTLSQLSIMLISMGLGLEDLCFFHLLMHALFKSLLFLCVGVYIHTSLDSQSMNLMGLKSLGAPLLGIYFLTSIFSLCGLPFLAGFYSKDLILEYYFMSYSNFLVCYITLLGVTLTFLYSYRLWSSLLFSSSSSFPYFLMLEMKLVFLSIFLLWGFSVLGGAMLVWLLYPTKVISLTVVNKNGLLFLLIFYVVTLFLVDLLNKSISIKPFYFSKALMGLSFIWLFSPSLILWEGKKMFKLMDHGWLEGLFGFGLALKQKTFFLDYSTVIYLKSMIYLIILLIVML